MDVHAPYANISTEALGKTLSSQLNKNQRAELKKRAAEGDTRAEELLVDARARENEVKRRRRAEKKRKKEEDYGTDSSQEREEQAAGEESDGSDVPLVRRASNKSMATYAPYAKVSTEELGKMLGKKLKPKQREELRKRAEDGDVRAEELLNGARAKEKEDTRRRRAEKRQQDEEDAYEDEYEEGDSQQSEQEDEEDSDVPIMQSRQKKGIARPVKHTEKRGRPTSRTSRTSTQEVVVYSTDEEPGIDNSRSQPGDRRRRLLQSDEEDTQIVPESVRAASDVHQDELQQSAMELAPSVMAPQRYAAHLRAQAATKRADETRVASEIDREGLLALRFGQRAEVESREVVADPIESSDRAERAARMKANKEEGDCLMERLEQLQKERRARDEVRQL